MIVENRFAGRAILHALRKNIAYGAISPEHLAATLKEAKFGDEQIKVLADSYVKKDINIAKQYFDEKIAKNSAEILAGNFEQKSAAAVKEAQKEKRGIWNVTFNGKSAVDIKMDDLSNIIRYEHEDRKTGAVHIVQKHLGNGKYGELTKAELLNIGEIIRKGEMPEGSVRISEDGTKSYTYELAKDGVRYRVAVMENADGKKILTMYSDKNTKVNSVRDPAGENPIVLNRTQVERRDPVSQSPSNENIIPQPKEKYKDYENKSKRDNFRSQIK
ncbi:MAG: hypothetical protein LBB59_06140 [Campylobacteraceae bacterium]|nr:hypothetical protein [Campylobacteraceae bacterium]